MKRQKAEPKKTEATAFTFGDPEPVLQGGIYEYVGIWLLDNGRYYSSPAGTMQKPQPCGNMTGAWQNRHDEGKRIITMVFLAKT